MEQTETIGGVLLSSTMDLKSFYGLDFTGSSSQVRLFDPHEVSDPASIRFAVCWLPDDDAFARYPNLQMAMSVGAGVDALLANPSLAEDSLICRVRDPHQADLMAGYAAHEALHFLRSFTLMKDQQSARIWNPLPMSPPKETRIAVLGNGTMGAAIARALSAMGFSVTVACRCEPREPQAGISYHSGANALDMACKGSRIAINVLPLTDETENILNGRLFNQLEPGAWLIQIGRGEHLHEADFAAALDNGQLAGASLDVFREEPLPKSHPFWHDDRLRITPHIASDSTPSVVAEQICASAVELLQGKRPQLAIDRHQGY
ncbi:NAD(P)-dependent oxidoreductase [Roseibium marinum]|uniref:Glyoxylate/hydroxypyruvate reductase A n=1 Tax=Roseibium marinum TaxID=281252 RepID=A0A2S3V2G5_9HYPH|nr:NAD(P)-dependent oxidoreductase [Roseibium marinum]POF33973.1 glyoxylate/hydroxypyruvate reductase A [Roseibium marinum]